MKKTIFSWSVWCLVFIICETDWNMVWHFVYSFVWFTFFIFFKCQPDDLQGIRCQIWQLVGYHVVSFSIELFPFEWNLFKKMGNWQITYCHMSAFKNRAFFIQGNGNITLANRIEELTVELPKKDYPVLVWTGYMSIELVNIYEAWSRVKAYIYIPYTGVDGMLPLMNRKFEIVTEKNCNNYPLLVVVHHMPTFIFFNYGH